MPQFCLDFLKLIVLIIVHKGNCVNLDAFYLFSLNLKIKKKELAEECCRTNLNDISFEVSEGLHCEEEAVWLSCAEHQLEAVREPVLGGVCLLYEGISRHPLHKFVRFVVACGSGWCGCWFDRF